MELLLLRHGIAEDAGPATDYRDERRELTARGVQRMRLAVAGMRTLGLAPRMLVCSPLVRCVQTATIVGEGLDLEPRVDERLRPGMTVDDVASIHAENPDVERLMLCGHQPDLSIVASDLIGGGLVEFKKGALALLDVASMRSAGGSLAALHPPRALRALAKASS